MRNRSRVDNIMMRGRYNYYLKKLTNYYHHDDKTRRKWRVIFKYVLK